MSRKFKIHYNLTRVTGSLDEDQFAFLITFRSLLLRKANISNKLSRENQSTYFNLSNI